MQHETLSNGLQLIAYETPKTDKATVVAYIRSGSAFETAENNGISHMLEHLLFQGTEDHPDATTLQQHLDRNGLDAVGTTSKQYTTINIQGPTTSLSEATGTLCAMLWNARLDEESIEREQRVLVDEMCQRETEPAHQLMQLSDQTLYNGTAYALPAGGSSTSLRTFASADVRGYYRSAYVPANIVIGVAGNRPEEELRELGRSYADGGSYESHHLYPDISLPADDLGVHTTSFPGLANRTMLTWSFFSPEIYKGCEGIIWILASALEEHLTTLLRYEHGLAYSIGVDWLRLAVGNQIDIDVECAHANHDDIVDRVESVLASDWLTDTAVENARSRLRQSLSYLPEDSSALADYAATQAILFPSRTPETPAEESAFVETITPDDIAQAATTLLRSSRRGLFSISSA